LQQAAIEGVAGAGADVIDIGMCTTSMFNFAVSSQAHVDAGLMVTASHNPPEYNGIKMALSSGMPVPGMEMLEAVQEADKASEADKARRTGTVSDQDVLEPYLAKCLEGSTLDLSGAKVVVDYGNGMGAMSVRPLLQRLGATVVELYPEPDARFPNHEANPAKEETLADLKAAVVREGADIGIALDGDADRVAFVDNEGVTVRGDQTLALLARDLLMRERGARIVYSPNQSWATTDAIREAGGEPVECPIGRTYVIKTMHEAGAPLGGELSSHFMFREFGSLEAVDYAIVRLLDIWKRSGLTFAELVRPLRRYPNSREVNIEVSDKAAVLRRLREVYAPLASVVNELDGIRCEYGRDWWFIVRPSNTEPLLRLTVEAKSEELMNEKRDELVAFMTS
jgi:phosphomannomutase